MNWLILWASFYAGLIMHLALQIDRSVRSNANGLKGWQGWKEWLKLQAVPVLARIQMSTLAFGLFQAFGAHHLEHILPLNLWTAGTLGLSGGGEIMDKLLLILFPGSWPHGLKVDIPLHVPPQTKLPNKEK
jgi:hypothetical protein